MEPINEDDAGLTPRWPHFRTHPTQIVTICKICLTSRPMSAFSPLETRLPRMPWHPEDMS
jgi:hypothetical protein